MAVHQPQVRSEVLRLAVKRRGIGHAELLCNFAPGLAHLERQQEVDDVGFADGGAQHAPVRPREHDPVFHLYIPVEKGDAPARQLDAVLPPLAVGGYPDAVPPLLHCAHKPFRRDCRAVVMLSEHVGDD